MKRRDLLRRIERATNGRNLPFGLLRHGADHDVFSLDGVPLAVPRHRELGERLSESIFRQCESKLGRRWWR